MKRSHLIILALIIVLGVAAELFYLSWEMNEVRFYLMSGVGHAIYEPMWYLSRVSEAFFMTYPAIAFWLFSIRRRVWPVVLAGTAIFSTWSWLLPYTNSPLQIFLCCPFHLVLLIGWVLLTIKSAIRLYQSEGHLKLLEQWTNLPK